MEDHPRLWWERRRFLRAALLGGAAVPVALAIPPALAQTTGTSADPWLRAPAIAQRVRPLTFPSRTVDVRTHGAVGNGSTDCTTAIDRAIAACHAAGGGRVTVPAGRYVCGPIRLRSNVNLHLAAGATILFKTDPRAYLPAVLTRYEGNDCYNYSPMVYAYRQNNIAITGQGTLDGRASPSFWWPWSGRREFGWSSGEPTATRDSTALREQAERGVPVAQRQYGGGHYLRPPFLQPYGCNDVLIEGITIRNAPMWIIHPFLCRRVAVRNVRIDSIGPNNDGIDVECSSDVLIEGCRFNAGDDCVVMKSGRGRDGFARNVATHGVYVRNCVMTAGNGAIATGSEGSGGIYEIFAENLTVSGVDELLLMKNSTRRGGTHQNIYLRNVRGSGLGTYPAVYLTYNFPTQTQASGGPYTPRFANVQLRNITGSNFTKAIKIAGHSNNPIRDVHITDATFTDIDRSTPEIFGASNVRLTRVRINGRTVVAGA